MTTSYPGMVTAWVGTGLLIAVVISSIVIVQRRLSYEAWYAVHLATYAGIALAWFHQIPTGNELVLRSVVDAYWRSLYIATLAAIVVFRLAVPAVNGFRHRLRVVEVVPEGPGVVSIRIAGRALDRLRVHAGQFFLGRFKGKRKVTRRMTDLSATYPDHTHRSVYINEQAIPILRSAALQAQSANIQMVSGAMATTYAFAQSLQSAIVQALHA